MANQIDPAVSERYDVVDKGDEWHLFCKICRAGFRLKKPGDHPGNVLALLNHHAECASKVPAQGSALPQG